MTRHSIRLAHVAPLKATFMSFQARYMNADVICGGHTLTDVQRVLINKLMTTWLMPAIRNFTFA